MLCCWKLFKLSLERFVILYVKVTVRLSLIVTPFSLD